eukprot:2099715-Amphidinium_carterae.1
MSGDAINFSRSTASSSAGSILVLRITVCQVAIAKNPTVNSRLPSISVRSMRGLCFAVFQQATH